jgi:hypothetical protein
MAPNRPITIEQELWPLGKDRWPSFTSKSAVQVTSGIVPYARTASFCCGWQRARKSGLQDT